MATRGVAASRVARRVERRVEHTRSPSYSLPTATARSVNDFLATDADRRARAARFDTPLSYKTAWFLCHRIREAVHDVSGDQLGGAGKIVEADETYVGGKPRRGTDGRKSQYDHKTPVAVLVERGGRARATVVSHPLDGVLKRNIAQNVAQGTEMHTDEHKAYRNIEDITGALHFSVTHYLNEFAKEDIHNNTAESWNALLKRSIVGSFHHVSREYLGRYCDEVSFRWDRRGIDDTQRTAQAIKGGDQKRLTYRPAEWPLTERRVN